MPINTSTETRQCIKIDGFTCDRCGYDGDDYIDYQEMFTWTHVGGYGSIWGDGSKITVILCQKCAYELFSPFAVIKEPTFGYTDEYLKQEGFL